jgi:hypothetical protein
MDNQRMNPNIMKNFHLKLCLAMAAVSLALPLLGQTTSAYQPQELTRVVPYELGDSEFAAGDSITIQELRGTAEKIQPGETYSVSGTYSLNSESDADLSFFATTTNRNPTPIDPQQTVHVTKGTGAFRLIKKVTEGGFLHLTFYSRTTGRGFGGVYFGQGQWVLRNKHFSYGNSASAPEKAETAQSVSFTGPNKVLFEYLGNPVSAPENLDIAYTKEGLTQGMREAAQAVGVSLVRIEIDDSEFPCLIGIVAKNGDDMAKFKEKAKKQYGYSSSVGGETTYAMNLVPSRVFPPEARQRIFHRIMLREAILYDKIQPYAR